MMFSRFFSTLKVRFFITIFVSVFAIITLIFLAELYLVNTYYYDQRVETLVENTKSFVSDIEDAEDEGEMYYLLEVFQEENSAFIDYSFVDYYAMEGMEFIYLTLLGENNQYYYMSLDNETLPNETLDTLSEFDDVTVVGEIFDDELIPYQINDLLLYDLTNEDIIELLKEGEGIIRGNFAIVEIFKEPVMIDDVYLNAMDFDTIYDDLEVLEEGSIGKDANYYIYEEPFSKSKTLIIDYEVQVSGETVMLRIQSSLQSVEDFVEMMKPFVALFYALGLLIAFIIALVLARRVSKPIVDITNKANTVAKLEFNEPIEYSGKSELGTLASSINTMSENLEASMNRLEAANQELLQSLDKERANDSRRREFISNASHEIKTPLGIAKGYVEALKDGIRTEKREQYIDITLDELDRVNKIVLNLLSLMRHEDSEQDLVLTQQAIEPIIDDLMVYFKLMAREKQMELIKLGEFTQGFIDEKSFKQVFMNLLSNGIKYGVEASEILVEASSTEELLTLEITNQVEEPDQIDLEKMWYKFYTLDTSHNSQTSGTGLGLPIVKSILERYQSDYGFALEGNKLTFRMTIRRNET